jgi:predicted double-glycine peptidase
VVVLAALSRYSLARNARLAAGVFILAALCGCSSLLPQTAQLRETLPEPLHERVELKDVPFFAQRDYQCGPAALATVLVAEGVKVTPDELVPEVYLPERKGSLQIEMLAAPRRHGLVSYQLAPRFADMLQEIAAGNPVVVLQNLGFRDGWHYAVAIGYDYDYGKLYLRSGETKRRVMPFAIHELVWMRGGYWSMVALPPDRIPATADPERWLSAVAAVERTDARTARTAYQTYLKRWPDNVSAAIGLANTHHALGELAAAEAVLRRAQQLDPNSVIVLNNLAQTLSDQGKDAEALQFIDRAAALGGPYSKAVEETREAIRARLRK